VKDLAAPARRAARALELAVLVAPDDVAQAAALLDEAWRAIDELAAAVVPMHCRYTRHVGGRLTIAIQRPRRRRA
jgi:hypothetical protein